MLTHILHVEGMTCDHCVVTLTRNLKATPGVRQAEVSLPAKTARVKHDDAVNVGELLAAVQKSGFRVSSFQRS